MVLPAVPLRLCKGERDRDRARPVEDRRHREVEPRHADPYPVLLLPRRLARDGLLNRGRGRPVPRVCERVLLGHRRDRPRHQHVVHLAQWHARERELDLPPLDQRVSKRAGHRYRHRGVDGTWREHEDYRDCRVGLLVAATRHVSLDHCRLDRLGLRGHAGRRGLPESRGRLRLAAAPSATAGPMRWAPWKFAVSLFSRSSAGLTSPAAAILQEIATVPTSYARLRSLRSRDSPLHAALLVLFHRVRGRRGTPAHRKALSDGGTRSWPWRSSTKRSFGHSSRGCSTTCASTKGRSGPSPENTGTTTRPASTHASSAGTSCLPRR